MTVAVQTPWLVYTTDGLQTSFPYDFYLKQASDLAVYWDDGLLPPGMYTVTGVGQTTGGSVVFAQPLPPGEVVLRRQTPQNQLTNYLEGDAFPAESHEMGLDRLTLLVQDLMEHFSRASMLGLTTGTAHRHLVLPDPLPNGLLGWDSAAAQWTLHPSGIQQITVNPVSGIGSGKNTVTLTPTFGTGQAQALVFPAGVLAVAVTVWIQASFGTSQGLQAIGIGTPESPDRWGYLTQLTAESTTTAGLFQGYSGQPQMGGGSITLTAYGGAFDGTGTAYVTGHFLTFQPAHSVGQSYTPGASESPPALPATETQVGITRYGTPAETTPGVLTTVATHPAGVKAMLDARLVPGTETSPGPLELATSAETVTGTLTTHATHPAGVKSALDARVPPGTALSVARYAAGGATLESAPVSVDATGNLLLGAATPGTTAAGVLVLASGTAPSTAPADVIQLWAADQDGTAGTTTLHLRTEGATLKFGNGIIAKVATLNLSTSTVALPYSIVAIEEAGRTFIAANATEMTQVNLPGAATGFAFKFIVTNVQGLRVRAAAGDNLRLGSTTGSAAGYLQSITVGDYLELVAINATTWQCRSPAQGWTLGT